MADTTHNFQGIPLKVIDNGDGTFSFATAAAAGSDQVQGNVAAGATDSGKPVKIGANHNTSKPTYTNGQRGDLQITNKGDLFVAPVAAYGAGWNPFSMAGNSGDGNNGASILAVATQVFNGVGYDFIKNNQEATLLASAARTTTQTSADIVNYNGKTDLVVVLDVTNAGTGSLTLSIEGKDEASGKYYTLLTGAAVNTNSTNRYRVGPLLAAVANAIAQDLLPRKFRIVVTANNANSVTYSVGYCLLR